MTARLLSFVVWAVVLASAVFWGSRFLVQPVGVPEQATAVGPGPVPAGPLVRLFGAPPVVVAAAPPVVAADARFKLLGVMAARPGQRSGWALIAVDERPARAFALGAKVDDQWVVQSIAHRQVELGVRGAAPSVALSLSPVAEAARGVPAPVAAGAPLPAPILSPAPPPAIPTGRFGGGPGHLQVPPASAQNPQMPPMPQIPFANGVNGGAGAVAQPGQPVEPGTPLPSLR